MKLSEIVELFACEVYTKEIYDPHQEINHAFCADLMSDALMILSTVRDTGLLEEAVLVTGLATNQSIRTAEMLDVEVILLVRGKVPASQVIELANESNITLLGTKTTMFNASGQMYAHGVRGITSAQ
ncbi:MAG: hypothetical protein U1C51_04835 [Candidatus Izemoplasmatales bacterium]|jgi:hypothetical protein|nr:transcriptional regulator [bacterium]MDZ4196559.1 hypothetical protein [Candidatus Izemoplasmatales bacterium]